MLPPYLIILSMIDVTFYKYSGKNNTLPKTLPTGTTLQGLLRESYDRDNPVITVRASTVFDYNYCYVPVFGRYYFIERVEVQSNDTYRLTLTVDVLQTYSNTILESTAILTSGVDNTNKYASNRTNVYDVRQQRKVLSFTDASDTFSDEGKIVMITIKGNK